MRGFSLSFLLALFALGITLVSLAGTEEMSASVWVTGAVAAPGLVLGMIELTKAHDRKQGRGRPIAAIVICICVLCFDVWAANRPREAGDPRSELPVLSDIRAVISGERGYQSANGAYDTLDCLAAPWVCVPGYPEIAPTFLDSTVASGQPRSGYKRAFLAGPTAKGLSASSMSSFAYLVVPITPGQRGQRAFCGDASGTICATKDGSMPLVRDGRCVVAVGRWFTRASDCTPLQ